MAQSCCRGSHRLRRRSSDQSREQEKNMQDFLSAAHLHKVISVPTVTVESHFVLPSDCSVAREHTVAVPISPPTRDLQGQCCGHHPIGWTNERTRWIVIKLSSYYNFHRLFKILIDRSFPKYSITRVLLDWFTKTVSYVRCNGFLSFRVADHLDNLETWTLMRIKSEKLWFASAVLVTKYTLPE